MTITDEIIRNIRQIVQSGEPLPFALTHQSIAKYYGVSLTPARNAVIALVNEGVVQRKSNGRLEAKISVANKSPIRHSHSSAQLQPQQNWRDTIIREVIERSLRQNTDYLREEATAERVEVSRTLVRQLFSHLAGAGLLEHVPRCGWRVHPFDEKEMMDYLRVRELLELEALTLARQYMDVQDLKTLLEKNQPGKKSKGKHNKDSDSTRLDNNLHAYWIDRCENRYIQEFFNRYGKYYSTLFDYVSLDSEVMSCMAQEHRDILNCLIDGDWRGARKALSGHIRDQRENVLRYINFSKLRE